MTVASWVLQVEVNLLTGETRILQADIIYDCGQSMNPAVDLGQVGPISTVFCCEISLKSLASLIFSFYRLC